MRKLQYCLAAAALFAYGAAAACTNFIVTKGASTDGSAMVSYAADSHALYGALYHTPGGKFRAGAMLPVYEWDTGRYLTDIPQAGETYSTVGNMNEHSLIIGETTYGGRPELEDSTGLIDYGSLIYITLQRAKTAREAILTIAELANTYGYASSGESFSIVDPEEAWIMELIGKGKADKGAVWVARRIPDGMISGHANHPRIHKFPLKDKSKETIYSPDVIKFARSQGYFDGKDEDFDFSKAYAVTDFGALRGCDARVWAYFNKFASGMDSYLPWIDRAEGEPMPLWVKPDAPVTATDMKWMMRDHFENTPYDMTQDIGAGPYKVPYRWRPMTFEVDGQEYTHERAIATQQTGFSFVAQMRSDLPHYLRGLLWFGTDDANTNVYLPIFCSVKKAPAQLAHGDVNTIDWNSNFWVNNYVANQAYNRYSLMIPDIRRVQEELENAIDTDVKVALEQIPAFDDETAMQLTQDLADLWAERATASYKQLGDYLFVKFMDGNMKKTDDNHEFIKSEYGMPVYPQFPGYDERYFRTIVNDAGERLKVHKIDY